MRSGGTLTLSLRRDSNPIRLQENDCHVISYDQAGLVATVSRAVEE
jgi:hypothetical protein